MRAPGGWAYERRTRGAGGRCGARAQPPARRASALMASVRGDRDPARPGHRYLGRNGAGMELEDALRAAYLLARLIEWLRQCRKIRRARHKRRAR